jgi:hypothetical protein
MNPTAKVISRIYSSSQRIIQTVKYDSEEALKEIRKFEDLMISTRGVGYDSLLVDFSQGSALKLPNELVAKGILEELSYVRKEGLKKVGEIKEILKDLSKYNELGHSISAFERVSEEILKIGRSAHNFTKNINELNNNKFTR